MRLLLLPFLLFCQFGFAQPKNIVIHEGEGRNAPEEPSILVNPNDPDNIIAAANIQNLFYSFDAGLSWERIHPTSKYGVYGDPCLISDNKGRIYFFHLSDVAGKGWADPTLLDRIVCQYSNNGGKKWSKGSYMGLNTPKDQDKEWAVADPKTGNIYVTWTQFDLYGSKSPTDSSSILFSHSEDRGKSWSTPKRINHLSGNCIDESATTEGAVPTVGPNGEVYVAWSLDDNIWFDRSTDQGTTWMKKDILAVSEIGGWEIDIPGLGRANGMPVTVCDLSDSPHRGNIYINWADQRNGADDTDIWLVRSTTGGDSWSEPIRVNDDEGKAHQFFSWMTVDQATGVIYIVYYDRRNSEGFETEVYLAWSTDGGQTFTNEKISEKPFTADPKVFFGDYNNISAFNGRVRPIWTHLENSKLSIRTAWLENYPPKK